VRFRRFSAEKSAGQGVFARRMSVQKQILEQTFDNRKFEKGRTDGTV
jgi:hypothetical protein